MKVWPGIIVVRMGYHYLAFIEERMEQLTTWHTPYTYFGVDGACFKRML
jgi:hypothetical protein